MSIIERARELRKTIEQAAQSLDDKTASSVPELFGAMRHDGGLIKTGTIIKAGGVLKRASVDLWDVPENDPDNAPTLWEDIAYRDGVRVIPETITATLAFALDELGWWDGTIYRSKRAGNTFPPSVTPEWWEAVE